MATGWPFGGCIGRRLWPSPELWGRPLAAAGQRLGRTLSAGPPAALASLPGLAETFARFASDSFFVQPRHFLTWDDCEFHVLLLGVGL